jgi:hypothetical protein
LRVLAQSGLKGWGELSFEAQRARRLYACA